MSGTGVTAIITTFNEADFISDAVASVAWADEIIVMDSYSTDKTPELVADMPHVRLVQHMYDSPARQKNRAIQMASYPWVFILDADERVPPQLEAEVVRIVGSKDVEMDGYWIGRQNIVWGKPLKYLWKNDKVIRLIRRDRCRYRDVQVHEEIDTDGVKIGYLKHVMLHYSVRSIEHYLDKIRRYARWQAEAMYQAGQRPSGVKLAFKPIARFFKHYLIERAFLDGKTGLVFSVIMAWGVWLRYVFLEELWQHHPPQK